MIRKKDLIDGAYYIGTCRNTNIGKWFGGEFIFINLHFNKPYIETIPYYGDVKNINSDGFIPIQLINIDFNEIVKERNAQDYKNGARKIYLNLNNNNIKNEIWKPIPNYVGLYYISNMGRIKKHGTNKILRQNFSRDYLVLGLTGHDKKRKTHRVHRLVALTFKNKFNIKFEVNHINGIKSDNRDGNLEWVTHSHNSKHMYVSGNVVKKLTPEIVMEIKRMLNDGCIQKDIALKYNISRSTVSEINTGKKWVNI